MIRKYRPRDLLEQHLPASTWCSYLLVYLPCRVIVRMKDNVQNDSTVPAMQVPFTNLSWCPFPDIIYHSVTHDYTCRCSKENRSLLRVHELYFGGRCNLELVVFTSNSLTNSWFPGIPRQKLILLGWWMPHTPTNILCPNLWKQYELI